MKVQLHEFHAQPLTAGRKRTFVMPPLRTHFIEVKLRNLNQLFNSMDPSPFHEKDLDDKAEQFIVSWAMEYPLHEPVVLIVHLEEPPPVGNAVSILDEAVHHFFAYRSQIKRSELRDLLARGRVSLIIGLVFLGVCIAVSRGVNQFGSSALLGIVQESLLIGGWVAMWRPLEIFLYDWWPLRRMRRLYDKLSQMEVRVQIRA